MVVVLTQLVIRGAMMVITWLQGSCQPGNILLMEDIGLCHPGFDAYNQVVDLMNGTFLDWHFPEISVDVPLEVTSTDLHFNP